jgi:hypothetical protein
MLFLETEVFIATNSNPSNWISIRFVQSSWHIWMFLFLRKSEVWCWKYKQIPKNCFRFLEFLQNLCKKDHNVVILPVLVFAGNIWDVTTSREAYKTWFSKNLVLKTFGLFIASTNHLKKLQLSNIEKITFSHIVKIFIFIKSNRIKK